MPVRRSAAVALAALALVSGCKEVSQEAPPSEIVIAAFNAPVKPGAVDPLANPNLVPTPNDLAMQAWPTLTNPLLAAQRSLLQAFVAAGGFPSDQAVGLTIPIKRLTYDGSSAYVVTTPPRIDPATLTTTGASPTYVVVRLDVTPPAMVPDVFVDVANCTTGQIAFIKGADPVSGSRAWHPGRYAFAIRAGAVKTTAGVGVSADQGIALVAPNRDLTNPENQPPGGLPAALASQLDTIRKSLWQPTDWSALVTGAAPCLPGSPCWLPTPGGAGLSAAFPAIGKYIPADQVAAIATFEIAGSTNPLVPSAAVAPVDAASGIAPLPLDLLRTANSGRTIAFNPAFGAAATGLTTLDGFSTTAMIFAPITVPVDASTVNGSTVHLFKIQGGTTTLLKEFRQELGTFAATAGASGDPYGSAYVAEPTPITTTLGHFLLPGVQCAAATCSLIVGLQPAAGADVPLALQGALQTNKIYLPPLEEATDYAVVITTAVKDMLGRPLAKSTVAKILVNPGFDPVATSSVNGKSLLAGIDDATATALQKMRIQLAAQVLPFLPNGETASNVAIAYTFRTQGGIAATGPLNALTLAGVPYALPVGVDPGGVATFTPAAIAASYGIDPSILTTLGNAIAEFAEVKIQTQSWLLNSQNSGAFDPFHPTTEVVTALVAVPDLSRVGTCPGPVPCAPLVVFEHGLGDSKAQVLPIAASLADRGFIVAAIDMPLHGERAYCSGSGTNAQVAANQMCCPAALCGPDASICQFRPNLTTPVDVDASGNPVQIGICVKSSDGTRGRMLDYKVSCWSNPFLADGVTPNPACLSPKGFAFASANRLISLNFFRVRDTLRQDVIDVSALIKALAPISPPANLDFAGYLATYHGGLAVDATKVYWIGHSGGSFPGTSSLAVNPRITRAVIMSGGATAIDVFANPDSHYHANLVQLLAGAGVAEGSANYLKFLQIGKWILDPVDPANLARYVVPAGPALPSQFGGNQPPRQVLTQIELCDGTVPNAQNTLLSGLLGRKADGTILVDATYGDWRVPASGTTTTGRTQWLVSSASTTCPDPQMHSNPFSFFYPSLAWATQAEAASFLASPANAATPITR